jgi:hypothetical protein
MGLKTKIIKVLIFKQSAKQGQMQWNKATLSELPEAQVDMHMAKNFCPRKPLSL